MAGAAIIETAIALPVLLVVILGAIQFALIYEAKATLNHASLQAARAGSVANAEINAIRRGLARGLAPLYSPDSSVQGVVQTVGRINERLLADARVRILNPTREAFADFGEDVKGARELPNDRLQARSTTLGTRSGLNVQDANLLRVEITYGYELQVPLVNWFFSRILLAADRTGVVRWDAFEQQLLRRTRLPVVATSTVRMQTPAHLNDAMVAKTDLPDIARIDANSRPADDRKSADDGEDEERDGDSSPSEEDDGRSLADGAFGFHGDHPADDPQGSGSTPAQGGSNGGGTDGSGSNGGSPAVCSAPSDPGGIHDGFDPPGRGQSSPNPLTSATQDSSSAASLPSNSLPSLAVGNPIHVATGNKYQSETDLPALPGRLGLVFSRHYNSEAANHAGVFGAGWRHAFDARIVLGDHPTNSLRLIQADGRVISFRRADANEDGSPSYRGARASDGAVIVQPDKGYRWRWLDGRELAFDATGKLTSITQDGEHVQLIYQDAHLVRVTDPQLRSLNFSYYPNGRVAAIAGPAQFIVRYRYDHTGNLVEVAYSDGGARLYRYEATGLPHHLTGIKAHSASIRAFGGRDQQIEIAAWTYDAQGRAISSTHPDNAGKVSLQYGEGYTDVTDAFDRVSRYDYEWVDGTARVTAVHGPGCGSCGLGDVRYAYGDRFAVTDVHIAHRPSLHYRYDEQGRIEQIDRTDLAGTREWLMRFHYEGELVLPTLVEQPSVNPRGLHLTRTHFDVHGHPDRVTESGYSPTAAGAYESVERTVQFQFDQHGHLLAVDGPRADVSDVTHFQYDSLGRLTEIRTPDQRLTRILAFDTAGRSTSLQTDEHSSTLIDYDSQGRIRSESQRIGTVKRTLRYRYDDIGRLISLLDDQGRQRRVGYDSANRPDDVSYDSPVHEHHVYAADDRPIRSSLATSTGHVLRTLYFVYDAQRRLTETRDGDGPPLRQLHYLDADNRPDVIQDPLGEETRLAYDTLGRLSHIYAPDGGSTQFEFDRLQRVLAVTAPNGARTRYRYDDFGQRVEEISPDRGTLRYAYDVAGNLARKIDARGVATDYRYDAANHLVQILQRDSTTSLRYRGTQLVAISNPSSSDQFKYDNNDRLIEHSRRIEGHDFTTAYEYDNAGKLIAKRMPSGERLLYTYNARGEWIGLRTQRWFQSQLLLGTDDPQSIASPISSSNLGDLRLGNGLITRTRLDLESGGIAYRGTDGITRFTYRRDGAGRIVGIDVPNQSNSYSYDAAGRLTAAHLGHDTLTYEYDTNGNRLASTQITPTGRTHSSLRYDEKSNRLRSVTTPGASPITYTYDAAGNPISAGAWRYDYDTNGRLHKLYYAGVLRAEYVYNAQGERVQKALYANGKRERTFFLYEQHQLIAEANEHGRVTREYLYLGHHPAVMMAEGKVYWIHTDELGAPWAMTDSLQRMVWSIDYEPFGTSHPNNDPDQDGDRIDLAIRQAGQYEDAESGTYYNLMRDYSPFLGRYLTSDPLGLAGGANSFSYVAQNPISRVDPFGLYLFAFDGTWLNAEGRDISNVTLFRRYYEDGGGTSTYFPGVGSQDPKASEFENYVDRVVGGFSGYGVRRTIDDAVLALTDLVENAGTNGFDGMIDLVGFSRGAATARAFANEVLAKIDEGKLTNPALCSGLHIRFMGLFDTVASLGLPGNSIDIGYDFSIDPRVQYAAQAVATDEHRSAFDLWSIEPLENTPRSQTSRVEQGFLGAHSDIGGGYTDSDLSDVALQWMHAQALNAGVHLGNLLEEHRSVSRPVVHDERLIRWSGDREIYYPNDPAWHPAICEAPAGPRADPAACSDWVPPATQRQATAPQYPDFDRYIHEERGPGSVRGKVDEEYFEWLREHGILSD